MYSSDLYQKALNRLDRRRDEDELRTAATLAEVSAKVPRLEEIQNQLRQVGFSISKAFFAKDAKEKEAQEAVVEEKPAIAKPSLFAGLKR